MIYILLHHWPSLSVTGHHCTLEHVQNAFGWTGVQREHKQASSECTIEHVADAFESTAVVRERTHASSNSTLQHVEDACGWTGVDSPPDGTIKFVPEGIASQKTSI